MVPFSKASEVCKRSVPEKPDFSLPSPNRRSHGPMAGTEAGQREKRKMIDWF